MYQNLQLSDKACSLALWHKYLSAYETDMPNVPSYFCLQAVLVMCSWLSYQRWHQKSLRQLTIQYCGCAHWWFFPVMINLDQCCYVLAMHAYCLWNVQDAGMMTLEMKLRLTEILNLFYYYIKSILRAALVWPWCICLLVGRGALHGFNVSDLCDTASCTSNRLNVAEVMQYQFTWKYEYTMPNNGTRYI